MTHQIPLSRGLFAIVDDQDFERVNQFKWSCSDRFYVFRRVYTPLGGGKYAQRRVNLQNFVMGIEQGTLIDHINRNPLDNRRENLRLATKAQNNANSGPRGNAIFKGITRDRHNNRWVAQITSCQKKRHLGYFRTPEAAAKAYDRAAFDLWGEFAYLNFPHDLIHP